MSIAQAVLSGVVLNAPEQRFTPNNVAVSVFTLQVVQASKKAGQPDEAFTLKVTCWRQLAEQVTALQTGQAVIVQGKLMMQTITAPDGTNRKQFELEASSVQLLPGLPQELVVVAANAQATAGNRMAPQQQQQQQAQPSAPVMASVGAPAPNSGTLSDLTSEDFLAGDEDIPF